MRIESRHLLQHSREKVWGTLLDPEVLSRVLPGVEKFEALGDNQYEVALELGVPALKGAFSGTLEIADQQFPSLCKLLGEGKGAQGWVRGSASIELSEDSAGTRVVMLVELQIGGRIAGVGQRVMECVAMVMAQQLFESIDRELSGLEESRRPIIGVVQRIVGWFKRLFGLGNDRSHPRKARGAERSDR